MIKTALIALCLSLVPAVAHADVPPPDDYVETCTVEKQAVPGLECQSCSAWHGERDACDKTLGQEGYRRMCKSWGASAWSEIWCKGEPTAPPPSADTASKQSGCAGGPVGGLALVGLALVVASARRTRRAR